MARTTHQASLDLCACIRFTLAVGALLGLACSCGCGAPAPGGSSLVDDALLDPEQHARSIRSSTENLLAVELHAGARVHVVNPGDFRSDDARVAER